MREPCALATSQPSLQVTASPTHCSLLGSLPKALLYPTWHLPPSPVPLLPVNVLFPHTLLAVFPG